MIGIMTCQGAVEQGEGYSQGWIQLGGFSTGAWQGSTRHLAEYGMVKYKLVTYQQPIA